MWDKQDLQNEEKLRKCYPCIYHEDQRKKSKATKQNNKSKFGKKKTKTKTKRNPPREGRNKGRRRKKDNDYS